ncbi:selenocysteine synthase : L-seryl-tRNA(Sec) selenium transferase OS=uncultured planctomycete GN=selA PE=3 SV=1: SelA [Gemmata massiliana]|uniref:L-seryl-tRNA(Sec) selenium transferase n=1 Tax=Gemmata massiliana TaxID=1210884 RepID=A0A6P2CTG7_9BACT|nr:L-seryl-tRNA(Sec) selenium transferase [Gemmata massiliana]VTR92261.1 selenocysteine synthase : L-seryl-tRNA(Sec) selenium transferase OS=uncultured planctomycete GN=selA PE=3 SV=1: SelA [Gemmata massiliana]
MSDNPFRDLPSVTKVLNTPALLRARERHSPETITAQIRVALDAIRARLVASEPLTLNVDAIAADVLASLDTQVAPVIRSVINATGIVLHTNLGRAPLHEDAARAAYEAARGYLNLELDLATGKRASRQGNVRAGLRAITGAESATAVNNCAAATVIALRAVAQGKEVVVSRGQLVEIGGSFRIPDVMAVSGATLREVGTTNITRLSDYERAITPNTAALMRVHCSNYRVRGYTKSVELTELVELGRKHNLLVIDDVGSGQAIDLTLFGLPGEPLVSASAACGADLVLFSGDKLLGGPQCGIIAGKAALIQQIERDPLMRALRLDKMTLAALEATLLLYRNPAKAIRDVPVLRMLTTSPTDLKRRSEAFAAWVREIPGVTVGVWEDESFVGGGSLPDVSVPTTVLGLSADGLSETELASRLRTGTPAVVTRVQDGRVLLDLRCVFERQEAELLEAITLAARK